jgi:hypothetical protein
MGFIKVELSFFKRIVVLVNPFSPFIWWQNMSNNFQNFLKEDLSIDFNLFKEDWHVVSTCDVDWCRIIWKPNYVKGANRRPPMQLP